VAPVVVQFERRGAVKDLFACQDPEVLISGAAGTGKSVGALMKLHLACVFNPGVRALIVRKTHVSLTASTLVTFREKVAAEALRGDVSFHGGSASEPAAFRYRNGSVLVVGGLDRPARLMSTEYDLAFCDEAIETSSEDIDTITSRLRNGRLPYQQLMMASNPGAPSHHLKQRVDAGRTTMLYSRHEDNPRMHTGGPDGVWTPYGATYLARLDALTGVRKERLRFGRWVAAEGLVYEGFDPAVHLLDRLPAGSKDWRRWWSVDFGYSNPTVIQFWAEDPDGRLYLYRELYRSKRLVEDHAKQVLGIVRNSAGTWREPRPDAIICDHDAEDRATLERHLGMPTVAARKSISDGVQAVQSRLKIQADGLPRLYVLRSALVEKDPILIDSKKPYCTEQEFASYVWPQDVKPDRREAPVKENDHGMDSLRYMTAHRDLGVRMNLRFV
jgi:phage terminase large subunit